MAELNLTIPEAFTGLLKPFRHKAFHGGRGSAKSHSFAEVLTAFAATRPLRIACGRQYQSSIDESVKQLIEQKIFDLNLNDGFKITDRDIKHRSTGSRFAFIGLDRNPDAHKSFEGIDILWVEEAQTVNDKSMEIIIPTVRKPGSEIWWSWNPRFEDDPIEKRFRNGSPPNRSIVQEVSFMDNPFFFDTELYDEMEYCRIHSPGRYDHIWRGGYDVNAEAQIFTNWEIGRIEVPPEVSPRFGLDFGFSKDPNALIKCYVIHETKTIYVAAEAVGRVSLPDLPDLLAEIPESMDYMILADAARPETIDYLCGKNFVVHAARKPPGSLKTGITWLQGYKIILDPDCVRFKEEARMYRWKIDIKGKIMSIPADDYNHCWDALRYACEDEILANQNPDGGVIRFGARARRM